MAYFPNGTSGECFDNQCAKCRFGEKACPVWLVQHEFNYDACNNKVATAILDRLVKADGTCMMFAMDPELFKDRRGADMVLPLPEVKNDN